MTINSTQKILVYFCLTLFLISSIYVPTEITIDGVTSFQWYSFLWNIVGEIALKILFVEWIAITVFFAALFVLNRTDES
jgi:hypothetical protein